ncbi:MAG: LysM peptidoglycan-binding domain-containing protein [Anaerolineales bacterium]|jgi:LysM repeat protein
MYKRPLYLMWALIPALLIGCQVVTPEPTELVSVPLIPYQTATQTPDSAVEFESMAEPTRIDPTPTPWVHIVQQNDTLLGIANRYGVTLDELLLANPDIDPRLLTIDQEIIIPGPEGESGPVVLPTPTPLPMETSPTVCYPTASGGLWCILSVRNTTEEMIEGISVTIALLGASGDVIQSEPAYSPHNILPPGAQMPMAVQFAASPQENYTPVGRLLSAIRSGELTDRYVLPELDDVESTTSATSSQMMLSGTVILSGIEDGATVDLSLLAMGLDSNGQVVGYTKWTMYGLTGSQSVPFQVRIISLGPDIADYEILVEGRLVGE